MESIETQTVKRARKIGFSLFFKEKLSVSKARENKQRLIEINHPIKIYKLVRSVAMSLGAINFTHYDAHVDDYNKLRHKN